ncbi:hypothetical protein VDG1235_430 [Verrucomicrobiia bacterium DG1235]|nr:hypothetical protein VDG1235_430 [Verrucomicrobiae bacterium DG1235]
MKITTLNRRLLLLVFAFSAICCLSARDEERPVWEQEVMLIYSDSSTEFNRLRTLGNENQRLALYTNALDTLYGKIEVEEGEKPYRVSQRIFRMIIADNDEDAIGLASAYYLARISQSNPVEQDMAEAKKLYWTLYEKWPERFFGQMAFVKYLTLEIYDDDGSGDRVEERIQKLEKMVDGITLPELRQNVHRILGEAYVSFDLSAEPAYRHLLEAYDIGIPVLSIRIEVLQKIGQLGEELGQDERALMAYDELLLVARGHKNYVDFAERAARLRKALGQAALEE